MDQSVGQPTQQSAAPAPNQAAAPIGSVPQATPSKVSFMSKLFDGRIDRKSYIIGSLLIPLPVVGILLLSFLLNMFIPSPIIQLPSLEEQMVNAQPAPAPANPLAQGLEFVLVIGMLLTLPIIAVYTISFSIRRLHDMGANGWLFLINLLLPLGLLLCLIPGNGAENKYGPPPQKMSIKQLLGLS